MCRQSWSAPSSHCGRRLPSRRRPRCISRREAWAHQQRTKQAEELQPTGADHQSRPRLIRSFCLRDEIGQTERGPRTGRAGDRRQQFRAAGPAVGGRAQIIGQLPSAFCVATRKSIPRLISGRRAVKPTCDKTYSVWPVAKASLFKSGTVWLQPPSARCRASSSSIVDRSASRDSPERLPAAP